MAKDSKVVYGASGKTNVLNFVPEKLHLMSTTCRILTMNVSRGNLN